MPHIQTSDLNIYYEQAGSGPDLLVLNGTGADLRKKPNIMDSPLTAHFRVTAFDQRGLGQTEKPETDYTTDYTMAAYTDDAAALMSALNIDKAMVLGISFGGMVGQELAINHAARVSRMALWCTAPGGAGGASYPLHELDNPHGEVSDDYLATMMKLNDTRVDDDFIATNPELLATARAQRDMSAFADEPLFAHGRTQQLLARAKHDCWSRLDRIACPVQLMGGLYDGIAAPQVMQAMATQIPDATLSFYEGGHLFMLQDGKVFPDTIAFFQQETA